MDQFEREIDRANERAKQHVAVQPRAPAARYDRGRGCVVIDLSAGYAVTFAPERAQGLSGARPADLADIEITASGYGLHFRKLDADLWLPSLLEGVFASRAWIAAQLGARGGKATSDAKAAAARTNGKLGGRPARKTGTPVRAKIKRLLKPARHTAAKTRRRQTRSSVDVTASRRGIKPAGKN
jgi:hypothetical protein